MQKEKFKQLYDHCQALTPYISRRTVQKQLQEIFPEQPFFVMFDKGLDLNITKGYFLSSDNIDHPFVKHTGRNVIVLAKEMNECWQRFVTVKEMMHLFDDANEITDSAEKFFNQLSELDGSIPNEKRCPQMLSEIRCFWMVLACLCPESYRNTFDISRSNNSMDDYEIAVQLKIPVQYVPSLFRPDFQTIINNLIG